MRSIDLLMSSGATRSREGRLKQRGSSLPILSSIRRPPHSQEYEMITLQDLTEIDTVLGSQRNADAGVSTSRGQRPRHRHQTSQPHRIVIVAEAAAALELPPPPPTTYVPT